VATATLSGARLKKVLAALEENWHAEVRPTTPTSPGRARYRRGARAGAAPPGQRRVGACRAVAWAHLELGGKEPVYHGKPGGEADSLANRAGGVRMALRRLEIEESRHIATYGEQLKALGDEDPPPSSITLLKTRRTTIASLDRYCAPLCALGQRAQDRPKAVLEELLANEPGAQAAGRLDRRRNLRRQ